MNDIYKAIDELAQNASRLDRQKIIDQIWSIQEMFTEQQAAELESLLTKAKRDSVQY